MASKRLKIQIISQEAELLTDEVDLILAPTYQGQIGILPGHIGLLTILEHGELFILKGPKFTVYAIAGGFLDNHNDKVTIMADSAVRADQISEKKAEDAMQRAKQTLKQKLSDKEFVLAEADLRRAVLELKVAKKRKHYQPPRS